MSAIIKVIQKQRNLIHGQATTIQDIEEAEKILGIAFDQEYREYLLTYGLISFDGRELTGLGKAKRNNVVNSTVELREKTDKVPCSMYIVENANIDGIIILQDKTGGIYQLVLGNEPTKLCDSFLEYMKF